MICALLQTAALVAIIVLGLWLNLQAMRIGDECKGLRR